MSDTKQTHDELFLFHCTCMNKNNTLLVASVAVAIHALLDLVYLTLSKGVYADTFKKVQGDRYKPFRFSVNAAVTYLVLFLGTWFFVVRPITSDRIMSLGTALGIGAMFGLVVYGVYNGTNVSTLSGYSLRVTVQDTVWGIVSCSTVALVTWALSRYTIGQKVYNEQSLMSRD